MAPVWTLMLTTEGPVEAVDRSDWLSALRMADRPGRDAVPDRWVLHADTGWSERHVDTPRDRVEAEMRAEFRRMAGGAGIVEGTLHRWLYARTARPAGRPCFWSAEDGIGVAGDWCIGPDAGDAVESGRRLAREALA